MTTTSHRRSRILPRGRAAFLVLSAMLAGGGLAATTLTGKSTTDRQERADLPAATESVVLGDLVSTVSVDGICWFLKSSKVAPPFSLVPLTKKVGVESTLSLSEA